MRASMLCVAVAQMVRIVGAVCPLADASSVKARDDKAAGTESGSFMSQYEIDDSNDFLTSDVGGPIEDQASLKAGARGSTLLEDFIFRQKIQHFDHERVSSRDRPGLKVRSLT
jgi:catalase